MTVIKEEHKRTYSVCPKCLKRIPAVREERGGEIVLTKTCPEHGTFSDVIWRNKVDFESWRGNRPVVGENENLNCPKGCGLCKDHMRATCCTLLEITKRCNLNCTFCFAEPDGTKDPELAEVQKWISELADPGNTLLQLSGGEPTVRDDLPEIVAYAKKAGCKYVQLNTNGVRLAEDEEFVKALAAAGLSFVFLQFDGVTDDVYEKLRRRPLLEIKKKAIENLGKYEIGVTLVPVIVPGVNVEQIGDIIRFAVENSPVVRGVHFQPVSYFGRIPELPKKEDRFTLDELLDEVVKQSGGMVKTENLTPSCCDHPMCGFHGDFIVMPDGGLLALLKHSEPEEYGCSDECGRNVEYRNREFVGRRWKRPSRESGLFPDDRLVEAEPCCCCGGVSEPEEDGEEPCCCCGVEESEEEPEDMASMEGFLWRIRRYGFTITAMAFQDAGNLDIERLRQCSLHVYKDGKFIPFCAYYLSPMGN